jgi:hypothetical protein
MVIVMLGRNIHYSLSCLASSSVIITSSKNTSIFLPEVNKEGRLVQEISGKVYEIFKCSKEQAGITNQKRAT